VGVDESKIAIPRPTRGTRLDEIRKVRQLTKSQYKVGPFLVNHYQEYYTEILDAIELKINMFKPDVILIPPLDCNQDHRTIHDICMTALRHHDKNHFVPVVLEYETPGGLMWDEVVNPPNYFVDLDLDKKIELYQCYKTQMRKHRSLSMINDMAVSRGRMANMVYAEGFKVLRLCQEKAQRNDGKKI
jgi:LmbE family N-acetylglucosaminyl deacetylase